MPTSTVTDIKQVTIRFSGDSGDGMQLTGTLFSSLSAIFGNEIATFPDFPAEIRAPQGSLQGVSGFQVRIGSKGVYNSGDKADVLVAMNPAALKVNASFLKKGSIVVYDTDSFGKKDLEKALFETNEPFVELGLYDVQPIPVAMTSMTKSSLEGLGLDNRSVVRSKNMFALGVVCWLFNRPLEIADKLIEKKFAHKPLLVQANLKAISDGYNYGNNLHLSASTYRIEVEDTSKKGFYTDINGNTAVAYGLIAAAEKAGVQLFLGSYPITPATEVMLELAARRDLGVKTLQMEDEIAGICTTIGGGFAGCLAATNTSGPGLALKSEALGLAVMTELPIVVIDVQRGGPSTGLPTKSEQSDLNLALYGRNGESPLVVMAAASPTDCFESTFEASKIALENMTPVILLTDGYIANGSSTWRIPEMDEYPDIKPPYVQNHFAEDAKSWKPYHRDAETLVRYWAVPGTENFQHRVGGLEKDYHTSIISTDPNNHQLMVDTRKAKIAKIADIIPPQEVLGDADADTLIVSWGGTYGHLLEAMSQIRESGKKIALAHFRYIMPLPKNSSEMLTKYKKIVVAEQNNGQFADYLLSQIPELNNIRKFNRVEGQPFKVSELIEDFTKIIEEK
jgi:2-oxoglutarate ferredoxin oxidoreductase subunit alpha